jgi:hypothetical protein
MADIIAGVLSLRHLWTRCDNDCVTTVNWSKHPTTRDSTKVRDVTWDIVHKSWHDCHNDFARTEYVANHKKIPYMVEVLKYTTTF